MKNKCSTNVQLPVFVILSGGAVVCFTNDGTIKWYNFP